MERRTGHARRSRAGAAPRRARASPSLLVGKVVDADGQPFTCSHTAKRADGPGDARRRYRHYVARITGEGNSGMRVPAGELETVVAKALAAMFGDGMALIATAWLDVPPVRLGEVTACCTDIGARLTSRGHGPLRELVERVCVRDSRIEIACSAPAIANPL